jgi:hypothetical protein
MGLESVLQVVGLGAAAGTRGALALLALGLASRLTGLPLHGAWASLQDPAVLGALGALAFIEGAVERDDDLRELLGLALVAARTGAGAAAAIAANLGGGEQLPPWLAGVLGAVIAVVTAHLRSRLHGTVREVDLEVVRPKKWLTRAENAGTLALAGAAPAAPFLGGAILVVAALLGLAVWGAAASWEARRRRPCPHCGRRIRVEASRCPRCGAEVPVERWLGAALVSVNPVAR